MSSQRTLRRPLEAYLDIYPDLEIIYAVDNVDENDLISGYLNDSGNSGEVSDANRLLKCKYCPKTFAPSDRHFTSRLKEHLQTKYHHEAKVFATGEDDPEPTLSAFWLSNAMDSNFAQPQLLDTMRQETSQTTRKRLSAKEAGGDQFKTLKIRTSLSELSANFEDLEVIEMSDGEETLQCRYCQKRFNCRNSHVTTRLKEHFDAKYHKKLKEEALGGDGSGQPTNQAIGGHWSTNKLKRNRIEAIKSRAKLSGARNRERSRKLANAIKKVANKECRAAKRSRLADSDEEIVIEVDPVIVDRRRSLRKRAPREGPSGSRGSLRSSTEEDIVYAEPDVPRKRGRPRKDGNSQGPKGPSRDPRALAELRDELSRVRAENESLRRENRAQKDVIATLDQMVQLMERVVERRAPPEAPAASNTESDLVACNSGGIDEIPNQNPDNIEIESNNLNFAEELRHDIDFDSNSGPSEEQVIAKEIGEKVEEILNGETLDSNVESDWKVELKRLRQKRTDLEASMKNASASLEQPLEQLPEVEKSGGSHFYTIPAARYYKSKLGFRHGKSEPIGPVKTTKRLLINLRTNKPVDDERPYVCEWPGCGKTYKRQAHLDEHQQGVHTNVNRAKRFECDWPGCHYRSEKRSRVLRHRLTHTDKLLKPYQTPESPPQDCEWPGCGARFRGRSALAEHQRRVHNMSPPEGAKSIAVDLQFACEWPGCDQKFRTPLSLRTHTNRHTGQKDFKCTWPGCNYEAYNKRAVQRHGFVHGGVRPFACEWPGCEKRFVYRKKLLAHMNVHTGAKPFACTWPGCNYRCAMETNLRKHKNIHNK